MRYSELKQKVVVNVLDGRKLGNIIDLDIAVEDGRILAIIVPAPFSLNTFFKGEGCIIPWQCIQKIGDDVILVTVEALL